jgi:hypothetical protein
MSASGQEQPFRVSQSNVRFAPKADIPSLAFFGSTPYWAALRIGTKTAATFKVLRLVWR